MPNVFTPNGDGRNDVFAALQMKGILKAKLLVFNRWGKQIYQSADLSEGWDGTIAGKPATEGIYNWIVQYETILGEFLNDTGTLNLYRK